MQGYVCNIIHPELRNAWFALKCVDVAPIVDGAHDAEGLAGSLSDNVSSTWQEWALIKPADIDVEVLSGLWLRLVIQNDEIAP